MGGVGESVGVGIGLSTTTDPRMATAAGTGIEKRYDGFRSDSMNTLCPHLLQRESGHLSFVSPLQVSEGRAGRKGEPSRGE